MRKSQRIEKKRLKRNAAQFRKFERRGGWRRMFLGLKAAYGSYADNLYVGGDVLLEKIPKRFDFCGNQVMIPISFSGV
jgi:hypothetical protein